MLVCFQIVWKVVMTVESLGEGGHLSAVPVKAKISYHQGVSAWRSVNLDSILNTRLVKVGIV